MSNETTNPATEFSSEKPAPPKTEAVAAPVKKCRITDVLPQSVRQLLATAPQNETIRAVILAHLKVPIPPDKLTYDDIKSWIEETIDPATLFAKKPSQQGGSSRPRVDIPIQGSATQNGTCRYRVVTRGEGTFAISNERFMEIVEDAEDFDHLMELIETEIYYNSWTDGVPLDSYDDYDYDHYEMDDVTDEEFEFKSTARNVIAQHLISLNQDEAERLGLDAQPPF